MRISGEKYSAFWWEPPKRHGGKKSAKSRNNLENKSFRTVSFLFMKCPLSKILVQLTTRIFALVLLCCLKLTNYVFYWVSPAFFFFSPQNFWLIIVMLAFILTLIPALWKEEFWLMKSLSKLGRWDSSESVMPHKGLQGEPSSKRSRGPRRRPATETSLPLRCRDTASELHWALWARKAV